MKVPISVVVKIKMYLLTKMKNKMLLPSELYKFTKFVELINYEDYSVDEMEILLDALDEIELEARKKGFSSNAKKPIKFPPLSSN